MQVLRPGIFNVGVVDWSVRNFHGYQTERGSSYNAYLIVDDEVTLIDSVKRPFAPMLLRHIAEVVEPARITKIVSNHAEPDHSGCLDLLMRHCPDASVITSAPQGLKALTARYGNLPCVAVKSGQTLSLGKRTLQFITTPMLHWPDNMVTYCPEERVLFSNDAFGQHLASSQLFDDQNDLAVVMQEAKKYYANILMLYGKQAQAALAAVRALDLDTIATGHGVCWRANLPLIFDAYQAWSSGEAIKDEAVVVFDSMWGSTELMARAIADAFALKGFPVHFHDLRVCHVSDVLTDVLTSRYLAVGSPTLNNQMMPGVAAFLDYFKGLVGQFGKLHKAFAFGSFGWGGQSVTNIDMELHAAGCDICHAPIRIANVPSAGDLDALKRELLAL